jgi:hypothetical protein
MSEEFLKMTQRKKDIWKGIFFSNIFALVCLGITTILLRISTGNSGTLVLSEFVLLPLIMGIINAIFWRTLKFSIEECLIYGAVNIIISLILSALFMGEGIICLLIVSPLIFMFLMLGIFLGRYMFKNKKNKLNISVLTSFTVIFFLNILTAGTSTQVVTDTIVINASPQEVWRNVVSFPPIEAKPDFWLFKVGLPRPVQSIADGDYLGANRKCIFSNGAVFDEKIVEFEPNKKLTFDITKQPNDPEIIGHLNLIKGQFLLQDNGDGTTTLIGNSWYDLKIKPSQYFDIWTRSIIRNVHKEVMVHIKKLSEATT